MNSSTRIMRSSTDRMIGGVCGGIGNYLGVDPTLVRIGFVLLTLAGVSPLLYVVLWVVLPSDTSPASSWTHQIQQTLGEMQERATAAAREVSSQVQKLSPPSSGQSAATGESDESRPATGPTTRL